ncbi:hypothetical protein [Devosia sp. A369]
MTDQTTADAKKVAFKTELLLKIGLAVGLANAFGPRVHMIRPAAKRGGAHRILCADGGWIEIDPGGRTVRAWGPGNTARDLARQVAADESGPTWAVDHLEPTVDVGAPGASRRAAPVLSDDRLKTLADGWRARGFSDVEMDDAGVWVALDGGGRLYDVGDRVSVYGPVTDEALSALVEKAGTDWDSHLRLFGNWADADRERVWLQCQRAGVELDGYEASAALVARWEAERDAVGSASGQALCPEDGTLGATVGPMPSTVGGSAPETEVGAPTSEPDLSAFERKSTSLDCRRADLEQRQRATHKERSDYFQRTERLGLRAAQEKAFQERDELRQAEAKIEEARAILVRAREIAREKGLDYESAVAVAKAQHLAEKEHGHQPRSGLRR